MSKPEEIKHILDVIAKVATQFLQDEIGVTIDEQQQRVVYSEQLKLKPFTVMMSISGCFSLDIFFSFDERLIEQVYKIYCRELDLDEAEHLEHIDETASDMINIVIGNSTHLLAEDGTMVNISVPIVIKQSKSMSDINVKVLTTDLFSHFGDMMITAMPNRLD